jgi:hypothetical protein
MVADEFWHNRNWKTNNLHNYSITASLVKAAVTCLFGGRAVERLRGYLCTHVLEHIQAAWQNALLRDPLRGTASMSCTPVDALTHNTLQVLCGSVSDH